MLMGRKTKAIQANDAPGRFFLRSNTSSVFNFRTRLPLVLKLLLPLSRVDRLRLDWIQVTVLSASPCIFNKAERVEYDVA
jgi:hypothetical protein